MDIRITRKNMINQAVHRYDSAIKKVEKVYKESGPNVNSGVEINSRGDPMHSFDDPVSSNAMQSSF